MTGFGNNRSAPHRKKSLVGLNMSPEKLRAHAIKKHMAGDLDSAEKFYKAFIRRGIDDPDVLSNYALICQESGCT